MAELHLDVSVAGSRYCSYTYLLTEGTEPSLTEVPLLLPWVKMCAPVNGLWRWLEFYLRCSQHWRTTYKIFNTTPLSQLNVMCNYDERSDWSLYHVTHLHLYLSIVLPALLFYLGFYLGLYKSRDPENLSDYWSEQDALWEFKTLCTAHCISSNTCGQVHRNLVFSPCMRTHDTRIEFESSFILRG